MTVRFLFRSRLSEARLVRNLTLLVIIGIAFDPNDYKDELAAEVQRLIGRQLIIEGDLHLRLSLNPTLEIGSVALANADWGADRHMARVGTLRVQLALRPLLSGKVHIQRIEIEDGTLLLESNADGESNWGLQTVDGDGGGVVPQIDVVSFTNVTLARKQADGDVTPEILANGLSLHEVHLQLGAGTYRGELSFTVDEDRQQLVGELATDVVRIEPSAEGVSDRSSQGLRAKLFSSERLDLSVPTTLETDVRVQIGKLVNGSLSLDRVSLQIMTKDGVLEVKDFAAQLGSGQLSAQLTIDASVEPPRSALLFTGKNLDAGALLQSKSGNLWLNARGELHVDVHGRGNSLAEIMAGLQGTSRWIIGKGRADLKDVDTLVGGLSTALGSLFSDDSRSARLNCAVGDFKIARGIASSRLLLADSENSTLYGTGKINLRSERLQLVLKPEPKSITLNVAVPVEVGGSLTSPTFTPEKFGAARKAGGLLAAVGVISFPPAVLLGLGELGSGEDNPCLTLATKGRQRVAVRRKDSNVIERAADDVGDALKGIGGAVKGLFD